MVDEAEEEEEKVERPVLDQSIMDFYELKGEQLEQTYNALRRNINDEAKKQAIDSDEEAIKDREMRQQNEKLRFVNKFDAEKFSLPTSHEKSVKITIPSNENETKDEDKKQLPIIFHEREIMESLENNIVTIVCGETGSGKST